MRYRFRVPIHYLPNILRLMENHSPVHHIPHPQHRSQVCVTPTTPHLTLMSLHFRLISATVSVAYLQSVGGFGVEFGLGDPERTDGREDWTDWSLGTILTVIVQFSVLGSVFRLPDNIVSFLSFIPLFFTPHHHYRLYLVDRTL